MKHRKTVLLADGSDEFRWLMWRIAEKYSHISIMTVGTGRDVLLSIQKHMPDLLLMDVALPDICGLTVLEELRRQGLAPKTIFLSGVVSDRVAKKALDLGALHFIPKPFHSRAALDVICGLLHSRPQHPPLFIVIAEKSQHFLIHSLRYITISGRTLQVSTRCFLFTEQGFLLLKSKIKKYL